jgi:hypothetical protein
MAKRLAAMQPNEYTELWAKVTTVTGTTATINVAGDTTNVDSVPIAAGVTVSVGATVIVRIKGSDAYIAGRLS